MKKIPRKTQVICLKYELLAFIALDVMLNEIKDSLMYSTEMFQRYIWCRPPCYREGDGQKLGS